MFPDITEAIKSIFDPKKLEPYFSAQAPKATWQAMIINTLIVYGIFAVIRTIMLLANLNSTIPGSNAFTALMSGPLGIVISFVIGVVFVIVQMVSVHTVANMLGGKGEMKTFAYLYSLLALGVLPVTSIMALLTGVPVLMCLASLINFIVGLYVIYCIYKIVKVTYKLESQKAALVLVSQFVLYMIISVVVFVLYYIYILSASRL